MNKKTLNTILNIAGIMLGIAGLILILFSIFTEKDTLKWGMSAKTESGIVFYSESCPYQNVLLRPVIDITY